MNTIAKSPVTKWVLYDIHTHRYLYNGVGYPNMSDGLYGWDRDGRISYFNTIRHIYDLIFAVNITLKTLCIVSAVKDSNRDYVIDFTESFLITEDRLHDFLEDIGR